MLPSVQAGIARAALEVSDRNLPLLGRVIGIALARLGRIDDAKLELLAALGAARDRSSEYDAAATIAALEQLGAADDEMLAERDTILGAPQDRRAPAAAALREVPRPG